MQEQKIPTLAPTVAQASWTPEEIARIDEIAPRRASNIELIERFPGRSLAAIKTRLAKQRAEMGESRGTGSPNGSLTILDPDDPGFEDGWFTLNRRDMRLGSEKLLTAIVRLRAAA